jgi:UTP--glucose-1-phosphate uridylyltransferase
VPPGQEHLYGIIDGDKVADRDWRLRRLVEKPAPGSAPSRLAIIGRYVLPPEIFDILEQTPPGRGGEIQLTDAMAVLCDRHGMHGLEVEGRRFDAGDRAGYVLAVLYYALRRKDIGADVRAGAQRLLRWWSRSARARSPGSSSVIRWPAARRRRAPPRWTSRRWSRARLPSTTT